MGQKSGPWVRMETRFMPFGDGLTAGDVRHWEGYLTGKSTFRNISVNLVASSGDRPVGEVLPADITFEIDDRYSLSQA